MLPRFPGRRKEGSISLKVGTLQLHCIGGSRAITTPLSLCPVLRHTHDRIGSCYEKERRGCTYMTRSQTASEGNRIPATTPEGRVS